MRAKRSVRSRFQLFTEIGHTISSEQTRQDSDFLNDNRRFLVADQFEICVIVRITPGWRSPLSTCLSCDPGVMKPNPLSSLKNFNVPLAI